MEQPQVVLHLPRELVTAVVASARIVEENITFYIREEEKEKEERLEGKKDVSCGLHYELISIPYCC